MKEEEIARKYKKCLEKLGKGKMPTEDRMIYCEEEEILGDDGDLVGVRECEEKEMGGGNCYYELSSLKIERER